MVILSAVAVLAIPICVVALSCGLWRYLGLRVGLGSGEGQPDERPRQLPWVRGAAADAAGY